MKVPGRTVSGGWDSAHIRRMKQTSTNGRGAAA